MDGACRPAADSSEFGRAIVLGLLSAAAVLYFAGQSVQGQDGWKKPSARLPESANGPQTSPVRHASATESTDEGPVMHAEQMQTQYRSTGTSSPSKAIEQPEANQNIPPDPPQEPWRPTDATAANQWDPETTIPPNRMVQTQFLHSEQGPPTEGTFRGDRYSENPVRYAPWGNGHIVIGDPAEDPYLPIFESDDPNSLFGRNRANLFGQHVDDEWDFYNLINTDRPDFTDATYSVGKGVTIWESGYTFRSVKDYEAQNHQTRRSIPEVLVRYGVTDEFELRLKWNGYEMSDTHDLSSGLRTKTFGSDDLYIGMKYELLQQKVFIPMVTLLTGSTLPTGTNGVSSNALQPFVNVVAGWGIRRWLYLKASTGIDWQRISVSTLLGGGSEPLAPTFLTGRDSVHLYHGSASLLFQASKHVGGFVEYFNLSTTQAADNRPANYFDAGLYIYATTNVQFDVRFGKRLSDRINEIFTGAGFSVRY